MKHITLLVIMAAALSMSACYWGEWEGDGTTHTRFASHLQGTWVSNDPTEYSGSLEISYKRVIITGYERSYGPIFWVNDDQRPFRNFIKGFGLPGYSEEQAGSGAARSGFLFIEDAGVIQAGIPYTYWYLTNPSGFGRVHFLRFNFGGRQETLQRIDR